MRIQLTRTYYLESGLAPAGSVVEWPDAMPLPKYHVKLQRGQAALSVEELQEAEHRQQAGVAPRVIASPKPAVAPPGGLPIGDTMKDIGEHTADHEENI